MPARAPGGVISAVRPGSPAAKAGLRPGDVLLEIEGHVVADVIDVRYYGAEETARLEWIRGGKIHRGEARRTGRADLGLDFDHPTFDIDIRRCNNRCPFCFVAQMAPGMRRSLHVRDDDYRYSFLFGQFVTLSNLTDRDWRRIAEQRLSPLYVSVQATEPEVRARCLGNPAAGEILERLRFLTEHGIEIHAQVVLVPGLNDGVHLERTLQDLAGLYPGVRSCSVVPVGITRYQRNGVRPNTPREMEEILHTVETRQKDFLARLSSRFAFLSDEWYLETGRPVPSTETYEGVDLRENGIGLVRAFLDDWAGVKSGLRAAEATAPGKTADLVTGLLFENTLRDAASEFGNISGGELRVIGIDNRHLGSTVTVAGLLTAKDVIETLRLQPGTGPVLLPRSMFAIRQAVALDDLTPLDVAQTLGREVHLVDSMSEVVKSLQGRNRHKVGPRSKKLPPAFFKAGG
jgi:putative radical SAM enzyme (TIGR03279 family)